MYANGNRSIDFKELLNAILLDYINEVFNNDDQLMKMFCMFNKDGDGFITPVELASQMVKMGHPLTSRELIDLVHDIDTNGDGINRFHEFTAVLGMAISEFFEIKAS
ncbi:probable calcium-binding protein CML16 [Rutidosis leptorrhynchoides]|uniref:probable calcium-binding protein CML16 n=1 Tax=Rutidosis leptorrhynchoides TaxID=125765 RepID=UPI003A997B2E